MSSLFRKGDGRITFEEFCAAVKTNGYPEPSHSTYWSFLNEARNVSIFDKQELAMILSHFIHESNGFIEMREKVDMENYPEDYNDSTCDVPGQLYYGRGYLKLSKCKNYREASLDIYKDERLVQDPEMVAKDEETAMKVGFSFWKRNVQGLPEVVSGYFGATTNVINGSSECSGPNQSAAKRRYEIYKKVRKAFKMNEPNPDAEKGCYVMEEFLKTSKNFSKE